MTPRSPTPQSQRGITLIFALIFLVILSLLGVTVASNNSLQEKMAGNTRQRDLAFQSAEHALEAADTTLQDSTSSLRQYIDSTVGGSRPGTPPNGLTILAADHDNSLSYWKSYDWTSSTTSTAASGIATGLVASAPRYVVEELPNHPSYGSPATTKYYYRVTARGVGKSTDAVVILQALYKFE